MHFSFLGKLLFWEPGFLLNLAALKPNAAMDIFPFRAVYPQLDRILPDENFFESVKEDFNRYYGESLFQYVDQEALFVYQIDIQGVTHTGIVGGVPVTEYEQGRILRHEHTISAKEDVQLKLTLERASVVKPVLLAYAGIPALDHWLAAYAGGREPDWAVNFPREGQVHRFYAITAPEDINCVQTEMAQALDHAYIADGHHRFSSSARLYRQLEAEGRADASVYRDLMCAFFPTPALDIHNFNRVVYQAFRDMGAGGFVARLSAFAEVEPIPGPAMPAGAHDMTMLLEREWFRVSWRDITWFSRPDRSVCTDVDLFNDLILHRILGIENARNDNRVDYIEGPKGLEGLQKAVSKQPGSVGFCLHPLSWDSFLAIIDAGQVLPPKSTWFEPRMKNGLIVQRYLPQSVAAKE